MSPAGRPAPGAAAPRRLRAPWNRAVFLDKDGTLVENIPFNVDPRRIRLTARASDAMRLLHRAGFLLIVVTNQSGIARGILTESMMGRVRARLERLAKASGAALTDFLYCPHHPAGTLRRYACACACRKPGPGMLLRAAARHRIDLTRSWLIGDILDDVEAGRRAGCSTILIDNDNETEWRLGPYRLPHAVAGNLLEAARFVLCGRRPA
jgi:histidinol-phosphate phosphatase family protein